MEKFENRDEIQKIINTLNEIDDPRTIIMGPEYGSSSSKSRPFKLRVYSHGGRILYLSTHKRAKNELLKNKGYKNYNNAEIPQGNVGFDKLTKKNIEGAIDIAGRRANGEAASGSKTAKAYLERSVQTRLINRNRTDNYGDGIIIDMEFSTPKHWMGNVATYKGKTSSGKPDLVVYDRSTKSLGFVELKYDNKSCENMSKHFSDFYNIIHGGHVRELVEELYRRIRYLTEYDLIEPIEDFDIDEVVENGIWFAFLFVGKDSAESKRIFDEAIVDENYIDKKNVGFLYVANPEIPIDYSRKSFFSYN